MKELSFRRRFARGTSLAPHALVAGLRIAHSKLALLALGVLLGCPSNATPTAETASPDSTVLVPGERPPPGSICTRLFDRTPKCDNGRGQCVSMVVCESGSPERDPNLPK